MAAPDHTRTSDVMANSQSIRDLTLPDMGPENEAMASTKRMDMSGSRDLAPVPELTEDLDYQIDTSVMQNNLPQFSSAEYEDADDDMSVEIGRGDKPFARVEDSRDAMSYDDSQVLISPAAKSRSSAPLQSKTNRKSSWAKENLRKDASIRRANFATKDKDVASKGKTSRSPNKSQRQSLADVHEKVKDAFDNPYLSDERSQARGVASKTTRFNKTNLADLDNKVREAVANAARQHVNNEYAREHKAGLNNTNTITDNQTRLSFALPDTENLSDLVSANLDHGPRHSSKSRATRFAPQTTMEPQQYASLGAVPVPEDEKIIFSSLRHLQEQVAALTADRDRLEQLERENADLRSSKRQGLQEDERRPTYVSSDDNDYGQRPAKAAIEKQRLEAANIALQEHLEQAAGKIASLETALKHAEKEKDAALSQRGAAYFASRELKLQNEELVKENEELQARIAMLTELLKLGRSGSRHDVQEKTPVPQAPGRNHDVSEVGSAVQDRKLSFDDGQTAEGHVQQAREMNPRRARSRPTVPVNGDSQEYAELFSLEIPFREQRSRAERSRPKSSEGIKPNKNTGNAKPYAKRNAVLDEDKQSAPKPAGYYSRRIDDDSPPDFTFLKFVDAEEIARLRRTLEQERMLQHKKVLHKDPTLSGMQPDSTSTGGLKPALKRKKSDVSRTGASADGTTRLTEPDEPTEPLPADKGADAENANRGTVNEQTKNDAAQNDTFKIPKPIPVSDRVAEGKPSMSNEPTQRPAQQPALALATVLKNLEDEVNDLKTQLEENQNALKAHDASLGKRQRKSLVRTIEVLLHDVDTKSDQIYALYDVLEGQKAAGTEMTQDEVEITMRDIIGEGAGKDKGKARVNDDAEEDDSELYAEDSVQEWNGCESSEEMPRSASRKKNSRVSL